MCTAFEPYFQCTLKNINLRSGLGCRGPLATHVCAELTPGCSVFHSVPANMSGRIPQILSPPLRIWKDPDRVQAPSCSMANPTTTTIWEVNQQIGRHRFLCLSLSLSLFQLYQNSIIRTWTYEQKALGANCYQQFKPI